MGRKPLRPSIPIKAEDAHSKCVGCGFKSHLGHMENDDSGMDLADVIEEYVRHFGMMPGFYMGYPMREKVDWFYTDDTYTEVWSIGDQYFKVTQWRTMRDTIVDVTEVRPKGEPC